MGCLLGKYMRSKKQKEDGQGTSEGGGGLKRLSESLATRKFSWEKRGHVNSKDHKFENLTDESCLKLPGSVLGNQFAIHKCKNCKLFIFDTCDSVFIDKCTNCIIYVGPTKNTIYLRNCEDCTIMGASHQFRMRDCKRIDVWLFCLTRPAVEGAENLDFACFRYNYQGLAEQFDMANLNPFNNAWSDIHDFDSTDKSKSTPSWHIMSKEKAEKGLSNFVPPQDIKVQQMSPSSVDGNDKFHVSNVPSASNSHNASNASNPNTDNSVVSKANPNLMFKCLGQSSEDFLSTITIQSQESLVLQTCGIPLCEARDEPGTSASYGTGMGNGEAGKKIQHCLVVFFWDGQIDERAKTFICEMEKRYPDCLLIQTRQLDINQNDSQRLFGSSHYERTVAAGPAIGLHYYGDAAILKCTSTLKCMVTGTPGLVFVTSNPQTVQQQLINFFRYKDANMT